jgi:hypothetical protein
MTDMQNLTGKKIFFLYPQTIVQHDIIDILIMQEYEAYVVKDHLALRRVLKRFPDSIVFVNLDEKLEEKEWEVWIREVMTDPATADVGIGVLSNAGNDELKQKYLTSVGITCNFIHISTDVRKLIVQLVEVLKHQDAMGRRKFIRVTTDNEKATTLNIPLDGKFAGGCIKDLSSSGFSCLFTEDPMFEKNTLVSDIQLKLPGCLLRAEAVTLGSRMDEFMKIYVFLFTPKTDSEVRSKIRKYIQSNIQAKMDMELKK